MQAESVGVASRARPLAGVCVAILVEVRLAVLVTGAASVTGEATGLVGEAIGSAVADTGGDDTLAEGPVAVIST
jgi:hypothetical protein